jgi:hypothetical protein
MIKQNKNQIIWNIVNSLLSGGLVFLGTCLDGELTLKGVLVASLVAGTVALTKFKQFWEKEEANFSRQIFNFVH